MRYQSDNSSRSAVASVAPGKILLELAFYLGQGKGLIDNQCCHLEVESKRAISRLTVPTARTYRHQLKSSLPCKSHVLTVDLYAGFQ